MEVKLKFLGKFYDIIDRNKCPSYEKSAEKCILRKSYFHHSEPNHTVQFSAKLRYHQIIMSSCHHFIMSSIHHHPHPFLMLSHSLTDYVNEPTRNIRNKRSQKRRTRWINERTNKKPFTFHSTYVLKSKILPLLSRC